MTSEPDPRALRLADFPVLQAMTTRWSDNDVFGHLNNAVYYELFDSAINRWVGQATGMDPGSLPAMGVVAETMVALTVAAEAQRKFGGDSVAELVRNASSFRASLR